MRLFWTVIVLFAVAGEAQQLTVRIVPETLAVDAQTNTASAILMIENGGPAEAELLLLADDFVAERQRVGLGTKTLFGVNEETPSKAQLEARVPAKGRLRVRMDVSKLGHAGVATSTLMNHATKLADLKAVKSQFPFNVIPAERTGDAPFVIRFEGGAGPVLHLKNEDPHDYFVRLSLTTSGLKPKTIEPPVRISSQSMAAFPIPADDWLPGARDLPALLKNRESAGTLHLEATTADGAQVWKSRDSR